ncbi:uncharacterized protein LOC143279684 [Babylonia areolata]|uniref:uncharacterized protein LOC143279684 n=1 Tax=Babylonia areolata TaxID=304850 RepID=UPI003FD2E679
MNGTTQNQHRAFKDVFQRRSELQQQQQQQQQQQPPKSHTDVGVMLLLFTLLTVLANAGHVTASSVFQDCGGVLEDPRGVVQSPGFPGPFPLPLSCRWVIHVPAGKKIVLYFTQYFLRGAFHVTEYEHYDHELSYIGRKRLGQINFEDHIHTLVAYKPYLVLDFRLFELSNIHLRVEEYLEDVYGFNITYEIVERDERVRQDTCSVIDCSFLGHCVAAADFSRYWCACFPGFFGDQCQYGPFCDPDRGVNMCRNRGRCRYFYGSMVNVCDCPPGYVGPKCEHREDILLAVSNSSALRSSSSKSPECKELGCRHHCERNTDGHLHCVCQEGFSLAHDNVSCIEQHMYRVTVTVPLVSHPPDWNVQLAAKQAMAILHHTGMNTAQRFQFDGINSTGYQDRLMLHFYVDGSDLELVHVGVDNLVYNDQVLNLSVVSDNYTVQVDPEMKLLSLENYNSDPALESQTLTLVCTARGSTRLTFRWYKDQLLFNASLTSRNAWEVLIQDELDNKQMSIFTVDGVTMFDKGKFTCEVEDQGQVARRTLKVDVVPLPHVELKPLTANVLAGQPLSFRCLSPDENMRTFSYEWLRNGQSLSREEDLVNGELVEDLLPSGSRLYIPGLRAGARYSCRVLNKAGAALKTASVFLIPPSEGERTCKSAVHEGVKWNRTYGGHFDLQQCPIDTADFKVVGPGEGYARRDCVCDVSQCWWGPPNYARCHSVRLTFLYEQLERCQLGYQENDMGEVWSSLDELLFKAQNRTFAGDVEMFATNLHTLFDITRRFPALAPAAPSARAFTLKTVASFMNMLLDEVKNTNEFEKRDLSVGARLLRVCEILAELASQIPTLLPLANLSLPGIEFLVKNVTVISHNASAGSDVSRKLISAEGDVNASHSSGRHLLSVSDSFFKLTNVTTDTGPDTLEVLQVTFSPAIFPILRVRSHRPELGQFLTPLVSVLPVMDDLEDDPFDKVKAGRVLLDFVHSPQFLPFVENVTTCVAWDRQDRRDLVGEWRGDLCEVHHRGLNVTRCLCPVPGHYAVRLSAGNVSVSPLVHVQQNTVLLVGCMLCLCGLLTTLLVLLVCWRRTSGHGSVIHANFIICLAGINLMCILCLSHTHRQPLCTAGKLCLHFLQLSAFSFLLMEATHTCVCIQSAGLGGLTRVKYTFAKYCLVGWGLPSLATLAAALLSEVFGYDQLCSTWCWWSHGQWQHLSFLVPLVVMVLAQVLILALCLFSTRNWTDEFRFRDRKKYRLTAVRSLVLQGLVVLLCVSGHRVEVRPSLGHQWFFVLADLSLTTVVVITFVFFKPHVRILLYSILLPAHKRALASDSFRAFVLPGRVEDTEQAEVQRIQQYCRELDRSKFTTQHKQALRTLLGSSSPASDASGTLSPAGTGSRSSSQTSTSASAVLPFSCASERKRFSSGSRSSWSDEGGGGGGGERVCSGAGAESRRTPVRKTRAERGDPRYRRRCGGGAARCGRCGDLHERCGGGRCGRCGGDSRERCGGGTLGRDMCETCPEGTRGNREGETRERCAEGVFEERGAENCGRHGPETCGRHGPEIRGRHGPEIRGRHGPETCGRHGPETCGRHGGGGETCGRRSCGRCRADSGGVRSGAAETRSQHMPGSLPPRSVEQRLMGRGGRGDLHIPDSGYEGTESDTHSFPPGEFSLDPDSLPSSESYLTAGGESGGEEGEGEEDTPLSSFSSSLFSLQPPGTIPRIALRVATPSCSPHTPPRWGTDSDGGQGGQDDVFVTADVDCDDSGDRGFSFLPECVLHTTVPLGETFEPAEFDALLSVAETVGDKLHLERDNLL